MYRQIHGLNRYVLGLIILDYFYKYDYMNDSICLRLTKLSQSRGCEKKNRLFQFKNYDLTKLLKTKDKSGKTTLHC